MQFRPVCRASTYNISLSLDVVKYPLLSSCCTLCALFLICINQVLVEVSFKADINRLQEIVPAFLTFAPFSDVCNPVRFGRRNDFCLYLLARQCDLNGRFRKGAVVFKECRSRCPVCGSSAHVSAGRWSRSPCWPCSPVRTSQRCRPSVRACGKQWWLR